LLNRSVVVVAPRPAFVLLLKDCDQGGALAIGDFFWASLVRASTLTEDKAAHVEYVYSLRPVFHQHVVDILANHLDHIPDELASESSFDHYFCINIYKYVSDCTNDFLHRELCEQLQVRVPALPYPSIYGPYPQPMAESDRDSGFFGWIRRVALRKGRKGNSFHS